VLTLAAVHAAQSQVVGPTVSPPQHATLTISGFWADINSIARAAGTGGRIGTRLDLERDLGLEDHKVRFIGDLSYQFNRRHGIDLSYFDLNRSAQRTLAADIDFGGEFFDRQTTIASSFDTQVWRLSYSYAFLDNPRHRATAQIGIHYASIDAKINREQGTRSGHASADAPLPVLGLGYAYRFSPRWLLEVRGQIFRLRIEDVDGSIDNFSAVVGVLPLQSLSVFAGYTYYRMDADISKRFWEGEAKFDYQGPWLGFAVGFGSKL